jgi:hypothetical protein
MAYAKLVSKTAPRGVLLFWIHKMLYYKYLHLIGGLLWLPLSRNVKDAFHCGESEAM